jgi:hypothetical protein
MKFEIVNRGGKTLHCVKWNNGMKSRSRMAHAAIVVADGTVHRFRGNSIPGVCAASTLSHEKNGKWSNSTFEVLMAPESAFVDWVDDWDTGREFPQKNWDEIHKFFSQVAPWIKMEQVVEFVKSNFPVTANRMAELDSAIAGL